MSKKINIILDLDECLLHCLVYEVREENYKTFSSYKKQLKQQGFESFSLKYKFRNSDLGLKQKLSFAYQETMQVQHSNLKIDSKFVVFHLQC